MAWDLRGNMNDEIDRVLALAEQPPERVAELYPPYPYDQHAPIVAQGAVVDGVFEQDATREATRLPQRPAYGAARDALRRLRAGVDRMPALLGRGDGIGSNAWVVDGEHSTTGEPMLANDPHLGVTMPGVWMQMGLHCRELSADCPLDVAGFTFSGVPGVIIGHNADIAWGFTNLGPDVTDLYLERVGGDRWRTTASCGRSTPAPRRSRCAAARTSRSPCARPTTGRCSPTSPTTSRRSARRRRSTTPTRRRRGADEDREYAVSLAWTALEPTPTADAILGLNPATDWDSFRAAAAQFAVPAQNIVYADREGHIGYQAPGRIPIRKSGNDGYLPAEGWRADDDWTGDFVPFEGLPSVLDPDEGFVVTANQAVIGARATPTTSPTTGTAATAPSGSATAIEDEGELSVAEMAELQLDDRSPMASGARAVPARRRARRAATTTTARSGCAPGTSPRAPTARRAAYFNVVWRNLLELTFHDELPEDVWPDGGQRWLAVVAELLTKPADPWWDDVTTDDAGGDPRRHPAPGAARCPRRADPAPGARPGRVDLGPPAPARPGEPDPRQVRHRAGRVAGQPGRWEAAGGGGRGRRDVVGRRRGVRRHRAPSMRMVVSLADLDESRWINLTGVSGHPFNDHYTDQTDLWAEGETLPWAFSAEAVEEAAEDTLTLRPAADRVIPAGVAAARTGRSCGSAGTSTPTSPS